MFNKIIKITEEYYGTVKKYSREVEVFKNPTPNEFRELLKIGYEYNVWHKQDKKYRLRYFIDGNDNLYMWVGSLALHADMIKDIDYLNVDGLTAGLLESDSRVVFFDPSTNSLGRDASILRSSKRLKYLIRDIENWRYEWDFKNSYRLENGMIVPYAN